MGYLSIRASRLPHGQRLSFFVLDSLHVINTGMDKFLLFWSCIVHCFILINTQTPDDVDGLLGKIDQVRTEMKTVENELNSMKQNFSAELEKVKTMLQSDACSVKPCEFGGRCVNLDGVSQYKCICKKNHRGHRCQYCAHGFRRVGSYCIFHQNSFTHRLRTYEKSYYVIGKEKK